MEKMHFAGGESTAEDEFKESSKEIVHGTIS